MKKTFLGSNAKGDWAKLEVELDITFAEDVDDIDDIITARGNTAVGLMLTHHGPNGLRFKDGYLNRDLKIFINHPREKHFTVESLEVVELKVVKAD